MRPISLDYEARFEGYENKQFQSLIIGLVWVIIIIKTVLITNYNITDFTITSSFLFYRKRGAEYIMGYYE